MDSFMHNHQSALDSFIEDKAIQDLEDAGVYPVPGNTEILETLFEEEMESMISSGMADLLTPEALQEHCEYIAKERFEDQLIWSLSWR